jgi:hypothetical protein
MRFCLAEREAAYLRERGLDAVLDHAANFVAQRLAAEHPPNDGKQTPMRGHPVFIAQHATATCCRSCLAKWHAIPAGRSLDASEQEYVVRVLKRWLEQAGEWSPNPVQPSLF